MSDKPLFQGMDDKERELAPQQVPGEAMPEHERDHGSSAGTTPPGTDALGDSADRTGGDIVGADGDPRTTPIVGVRPDVSANTPIFTPPTTADQTASEENPAADRGRS